MRTVLILLALGLVGCTTCGCRGGLFGGRMNPAGDGAGRSTIKVYEINIAENARSIVNVGNAGQNVPMYQAREQAGTQDGEGAVRVTTPTMPATGGANAGTAAGENVILTVNDGVKRSAETDAAMAAALQAGVTGSTMGQTTPVGQRQGTSQGTGGAGSAETTTADTTSIAPQANVAPGGLAVGSTAAPQQSPGTITASGTGTQQQAPRAASGESEAAPKTETPPTTP